MFPRRLFKYPTLFTPAYNPYSVRYMSVWKHVPMGPKDPILGVTEAFRADTSPDKLNLGVGAYRDDNGLPVVLPSVKEAASRILNLNLDNEYSTIDGDAEYLKLALKLAYGNNSQLLADDRVAAIQSLSGTGALRVLGAFISRFHTKTPTVYVPNPTWGNHFPIFRDAGLNVETYRYYYPATRGLDLQGMLEDIDSMKEGQVVLLHASAHNPTGVDPTLEQWKEISSVCKKKNHCVLFDMAYQGFASGDTEKDVQSVRTFLNDGHEILLSQSFAKNIGLYGQRVGLASIVCESSGEKAKVLSQMKILARAMYSNPPIHGARLVKTILGDEALNKQWRGEVSEMANRIITMRSLLRYNLEGLGSSHNWQHITDQIGMFCYSGLTPEQVKVLADVWHVYMTSNGRISMAGVTTKNVEYLAKAIHEVSR